MTYEIAWDFWHSRRCWKVNDFFLLVHTFSEVTVTDSYRDKDYFTDMYIEENIKNIPTLLQTTTDLLLPDF